MPHLDFAWLQLTTLHDTNVSAGLDIDEETTFFFKQTNTPNSVDDYESYGIPRGELSYPVWFKFRVGHTDSAWTVNNARFWMYNSGEYTDVDCFAVSRTYVTMYGKLFHTYVFDEPTIGSSRYSSLSSTDTIPYDTNSNRDPSDFLCMNLSTITGASGESSVLKNVCCQLAVAGDFPSTKTLGEDLLLIQYDETF